MDETTGEIVDDAQGWGGYKTARNAYRAHAYKKRPKSRRRKAASVERRVKRLMDANPGLHDEILADMLTSSPRLKPGDSLHSPDSKGTSGLSRGD